MNLIAQVLLHKYVSIKILPDLNQLFYSRSCKKVLILSNPDPQHCLNGKPTCSYHLAVFWILNDLVSRVQSRSNTLYYQYFLFQGQVRIGGSRSRSKIINFVFGALVGYRTCITGTGTTIWSKASSLYNSIFHVRFGTIFQKLEFLQEIGYRYLDVLLHAVLRIRIRKDPKLLAGSGSDPDPK